MKIIENSEHFNKWFSVHNRICLLNSNILCPLYEIYLQLTGRKTRKNTEYFQTFYEIEKLNNKSQDESTVNI